MDKIRISKSKKDLLPNNKIEDNEWIDQELAGCKFKAINRAIK